MGGNFDWYGVGQGLRRATEEYVAGRLEREEEARRRRQLRLRAIDEQIEALRQTATSPDEPELQRLLRERESLLREMLEEPGFRLPRMPGPPTQAPRPQAPTPPTKVVAPRPAAPTVTQPRPQDIISPGPLPAVERERERRERAATLYGQVAGRVASARSESELRAIEQSYQQLRALHPDLPDISQLAAQRRQELQREEQELGTDEARKLWAAAMGARSRDELQLVFQQAAQLRQRYGPQVIPQDFEQRATAQWERQQVPTALQASQSWLERIANAQGPARQAVVRAATTWWQQMVEQFPFLARVLPDFAAFSRDAERWERDTSDRESWTKRFQELHSEYRKALASPNLGSLSVAVSELNSLIRYGRARGYTTAQEIPWNEAVRVWEANGQRAILQSRYMDEEAKRLNLVRLRQQIAEANRRAQEGAGPGQLVYSNDQFFVVRQGNRQRIFDRRTGVELSLAHVDRLARAGNAAARDLLGYAQRPEDTTYRQLTTEQLLQIYERNVPDPDERDPRKIEQMNQRREAAYQELLRRGAAPPPTDRAAEIRRRWEQSRQPVPADKAHLLTPDELRWLQSVGVQFSRPIEAPRRSGDTVYQPAASNRVDEALRLLAGVQRAGPVAAASLAAARAAWERLTREERRRARQLAASRGIQLPAWAVE